MRYFLCLLLLLAATPERHFAQSQSLPRPVASAPETGTIWGQVRSERTGAPLANAVVEVVTRAAQPLSAVTDSSGVYVLRGVPAGRRVLRATHFDHSPHQVEVLLVADRRETIDFDLAFRPVRLTALLAEGYRRVMKAGDTVSTAPSELAAAAARALESTPGVAELGMVESARDAQAGQELVEPTDVLYVRGGAADLKLVLMNGIPVYAPFHVGGLITALDARVLRSASLHLGGAPSRLDGGLSYIMELESRSGRPGRLRGDAALDMLTARGLVEGPLAGAGTFLLSGRSVHGGGTGIWLMDRFPYGYGDLLARADLQLADGHGVSVTGFRNHEEVRLDTLGGRRERADWGNRAASLRYRGTAGGVNILGTAALARFRTTLPLGGIRPTNTEGTATRSRLAVDFDRAFPGAVARLSWGVSADRIEFEYRAFPQALGRDSVLMHSAATGDAAGLYADVLIRPLPRLSVRGGVRADAFTHRAGVRIVPRAAATLLVTDRVAITLSGGQYSQYVRTPERSLVFLGNVSPDSAAGPPLTVAGATHVALTVTQDLGDNVRLGLEGFFKEFTGLHATPRKTTETSGIDIWVRRATGSVTGWLGYSLAWVWTADAGRPSTHNAFAGRHIITSGVNGPLAGDGAFDVRLSYGAGLPYTALPEPPIATPGFAMATSSPMLLARPAAFAAVRNPDGPALASEPQGPFIRVDAQISHTFTHSLGALGYSITPYLKVINALNRRDAIFYHYDRTAGRSQPLAGLPVMPIIGAELRF